MLDSEVVGIRLLKLQNLGLILPPTERLPGFEYFEQFPLLDIVIELRSIRVPAEWGFSAPARHRPMASFSPPSAARQLPIFPNPISNDALPAALTVERNSRRFFMGMSFSTVFFVDLFKRFHVVAFCTFLRISLNILPRTGPRNRESGAVPGKRW